eukprot:7048124-Karenia_brevis.AAC.1
MLQSLQKSGRQGRRISSRKGLAEAVKAKVRTQKNGSMTSSFRQMSTLPDFRPDTTHVFDARNRVGE